MNLFDGVESYHSDQLARSSDPETSKQAAREIVPVIGERQAFAAECVRNVPGLTQGELDTAYPCSDPRRIGRRLNECERLGLVRRGESRKCKVSGKVCQTWWPVDVH